MRSFDKNKPERVFGLQVRCRELDIFKILGIFSESPISAVFQIVRFPGDQKTTLTCIVVLIIVLNFRCGECGAWSFDDTKGVCFLHTVDGCCGQRDKQENNSDFISGTISFI